MRRGFSIDNKRRLARNSTSAPSFLAQDVWQAVALSYDGTGLLRDSLVHRRVYLDGADTLIGLDSGGGKLRPMPATEQEAFVRGVLRLADVAIRQSSDSRTDADLRGQLSALTGLHKVALGGSTSLITEIPELTVITYQAPGSSSYLLDIPYVRQRMPWKGAPYCDLVVEFHDRVGQSLRGRLEEAPDQSVQIDPNQPPSWLT